MCLYTRYRLQSNYQLLVMNTMSFIVPTADLQVSRYVNPGAGISNSSVAVN